MYGGTMYLVPFLFFFFFLTLLLSSFWTSRVHRCRPFSPPVLAITFYRALGPAIPLLVDFSSSVAQVIVYGTPIQVTDVPDLRFEV